MNNRQPKPVPNITNLMDNFQKPIKDTSALRIIAPPLTETSNRSHTRKERVKEQRDPDRIPFSCTMVVNRDNRTDAEVEYLKNPIDRHCAIPYNPNLFYRGDINVEEELTQLNPKGESIWDKEKKRKNDSDYHNKLIHSERHPIISPVKENKNHLNNIHKNETFIQSKIFKFKIQKLIIFLIIR